MKRTLTEEQIQEIRKDILHTIQDPVLTHEQRVTNLSRHAESLMTVLDEPDGLDDLMRVPFEEKCICNLNEGDAPYRPRYIVPDYQKFLREGSRFLQLPPPADLQEALNSLLIFYHNVPSITNFPVFIGNLDQLLDPYLDGLEDAVIIRAFRLFLTQVDRTILDSFCHADIGPVPTRAGRLLMQAEAGMENAVPNLTMRVDAQQTTDEFLLEGIRCALHCAKPSFANDGMFRKELGDRYVIASCYNGLLTGGGSFTLSRLILSNIAKRSKDLADFKERVLPHVMDVMARYMDARIRFLMEETSFFDSSFLAQEGFIRKENFTAMFGLVGLAECVNLLMEKEGKTGRFGHSREADQLGVDIMEQIHAFNQNHESPYCLGTGKRFLLHAQVGISDDRDTSPGTRIPIGEEPENLIDHLNQIALFHRYFPSGTGDIFPVDLTVHNNPQYVLDIIRGAFRQPIRYLSFYRSDSDVIRVTGYLVKRSEMEKLKSGHAVLQNTTGLGLGASQNCKVLDRRVR